MQYFKLMQNPGKNNESIMCETQELYGINRYDLEEGKKIENWDSRISLYFDPSSGRRLFDYVFNDLVWFVISPKFKDVLDKYNIRGVQYLPIKVVNKINGEEYGGYHLANICNLVDALDLTHSKYQTMHLKNDEIYYSVLPNGHVLNKATIPDDVHIFRLKNSCLEIFVSDYFKQIVEENKIKGCYFFMVRSV